MHPRKLVLLAVAALAAPPPAAAQHCDRRSATGHIEFIGSIPGVNEGRHIQYSFSAILSADPDQDGNCAVHGEVEERLFSGIHDPSGQPEGTLLRHTHGDVVCVSFSVAPGLFGGTSAWIAYRGDRADPPVPCADPVNHPELCITHAAIVVEDNGEGVHDPPDRASALLGRTEQGARDFCANRPERPLGEVIQGNVQIKP